MARSIRLALFAGATALGAAIFAAPASAQFVMPWGVWSGPSHVFGDEDEPEVDRFIPPRVVSRILAAQGYRLASAPRVAGDTIVAIGENERGLRVRFVIDGYSGQLLRRAALNGRENVARTDPDAPVPEALIPGAPAAPTLGDEAPLKIKPKPKRHSRTAVRKPTNEPAPRPQTPAPSQAVKEPAPPAPAEPAKAPEPTKAEAPAAPKAEEPKTATAPVAPRAAAPQPAATPLAPDAAPQPKAEPAPASPQQAAVPATPAPEKPPLTPEAKAPATNAAEAKAPDTKTSDAGTASETPAATVAGKPADIGPRVVPVSPETRAPEASSTAKPAQ